mgnify:FL=1
MAWRHALDYLDNSDSKKIDGLISLPATAPLRSVLDVEKCIDEYEKGDVDIVITVTEAHRNPYFNMVKINKQGYSSLVISGDESYRRQDSPVVYDMTTVAYVARPDFIQKCNGHFQGRVRSVMIPVERAIDIDTIIDFKIAECLLSEQIGL